ncbi:hypothetical protein BDR07DRAFT_1422871 [Suillus spraguei]|nr:hypothetical protein BDR07DRAFT_1422871 [Suillus spraguei]
MHMMRRIFNIGINKRRQVIFISLRECNRRQGNRRLKYVQILRSVMAGEYLIIGIIFSSSLTRAG